MSREVPWETSIVDSAGNIRGHTIEEIMIDFTFEEAVNLLVTGKNDSEIENDLMRANIMSHCSHGITGQSTLSVLMAADSETRFGYAAFAGFMAGSGKYHTNAIEYSMRDLLEFTGFQGDVDDFVAKKRGKGERITGYGHRFHQHDPRARVLMELCDGHELGSAYVENAKRLDAYLAQRGIHMNLDGAGAAILLSQGIQPELGPLINFTGRTPAYAAHYMEQKHRAKNGILVVDVIPGEPEEENSREQWKSYITDIKQDKLLTYGYDQEDMIRTWKYEDMVYLLLTGKKPTEGERRIFRGIVLSYVGHELYDRDIITVRFSADLRVPFMYAGAAAFNAGSGSKALGKISNSGRKKGKSDQRGAILDAIIREQGYDGRNIRAVRRQYRDPLPFEQLAIASLRDMGVPTDVADLFPIAGRAPVWAAHYSERLSQGRDVFQRVRVYNK